MTGRRQQITPRAAVIIPAAGSGSRMKTTVPKQYLELVDRPVLIHTVAAFANHPVISQVIVVVPVERIGETRKLLADYRLDKARVTVVAGGRRRQDSVEKGLEAVEPNHEIVLVHDGARPLISARLIERCYRETVETGAAVAAIPVRDTLKKEGPGRMVTATVDRSELWQAQTPQGAGKVLLEKAFQVHDGRDVTDESSLLERAGIPVRIVLGEITNIKVTTPGDIELAEQLVREGKQPDRRRRQMKIGHGFDAHRFAEGRKLVLGGEEIPFAQGLAGHSDADVVSHALCDAILGALGLGDIGYHFPDNDETYRDICSLNLLDEVVKKAEMSGFEFGNADLTIVCQVPKLAPHIEAMKKNLADYCRVAPAMINIKATTTEKMGYTGRQEGISCHAVVLLRKKG
ncbi:MAG: bifunctional 2-C-methyl-D-erythritol 4-phosphate cytidylyltransferase/2-C-methyl-D-erythritol 2,4-cyclodiphosphate synthase [Desulfobacterales bacterium]|nr:MAG: bifunctional 2-C-methyl-D-erythritol 4-phosphate cytidylyltransferase/2-C-methyl-D-erythritol 2,4-cyclodiphosphate synthase [Desulfobacterales bacterium]